MSYGFSYAPTQSPAKARKAPIGYGAQYGLGYNGTDDEVAPGSMSEGERSELLQQLSDYGSSAVSGLFGGLNWLGSRAREVAADKPYGSNPSGLDVLEKHGVHINENTLGGWGRPLASFATEAALDPLTYTGFGPLGGGLNKAGRAAKAAGILDDSARAMSRTWVDDIINGTRRAEDFQGGVAAQSRDFWAREYGKDLTRLTDEDLFARPLAGWRESRREQTLGELLERQRDWGQEHYDEAVNSLQDHLYRKGGWNPDPAAQLDALRDTRLSNDLTFMGMGVNLPGGQWLSRGLDTLGSAARWSRPGAFVTSGFSRQLHGATDAASQVGTIALSRGDEAADKIARLRSRRLVNLLPQMQDVATDTRTLNGIRNVIEGVGPTLTGDTLAAHDEVLRALTDFRAGTATGDAARIGEFTDTFQRMSEEYLNRSRQAGIGSSRLQDRFGHGYFPRVLDDMSFGGANSAPTGGRSFSVMTGDQMARDTAFHVPGGTNTLQELSLDRMVAGRNRRAGSDEMAAQYILDRMADKEAALSRAGTLPVRNRRPATYTRQQAVSLARKMHGLSDEAVDGRLPIFGNPLEAINKYIGGRERAIRRAGTLTNMISSSAINQHAHQVPGGGATRLGDVLNALDLKTYNNLNAGPLAGPVGHQVRRGGVLVGDYQGARVNVMNRLREIGTNNNIPEFANMTFDELRNVSVDSRLLTRLNRIADFYQVPEVQSQIFKTLDAVTSLWKASILSWPARFVRDWYSGMFSNVVEVGNVSDLYQGYAGAKGLVQGRQEDILTVVNRMPRYARMVPDVRLNTYMDEMTAEGISRGRQLDDVGQTVASRQSSQGIRSELNAGAIPENTLGYAAWDAISGNSLRGRGGSINRLPEGELFNLGNWGRSIGNTRRTIVDAAYGVKSQETINPMLRWSARLGDNTDKINRISGYNALLLQGVAPAEAAKRIMAAQVDYSSLTKFERGFIRTALPFWAYESRVSKWVATKILEKPGGIYTQLGMRLPKNLSENDTSTDYVPRRISDKYGLSMEPLRRVPGLGKLVDIVSPQTPGVSSWLSDFDLPGIDQINKLRIAKDPEGRINLLESGLKSAGNVAEGAHPLVKMAYELGTGRDAYTGLKKNYARNALPTLLSRAGVMDPNEDYGTMAAAGGLDQLLQFTVPFYSRSMQALRKGTDPRIEDPTAAALQNIINMTSGVKVENIDDAEKSRDALETIKELLDSNPAVRSYDSTYIPKELLPFVDERTQQMYQLDRQLRKERRAASKVKPDVYNPMNY
jgi:hypothetical protein